MKKVIIYLVAVLTLFSSFAFANSILKNDVVNRAKQSYTFERKTKEGRKAIEAKLIHKPYGNRARTKQD